MFVMPGDRAGRQRVINAAISSGGTSLYSVPALSAFSWVNQGTSTSTQTVSGQAILLNFQNNASLNWRIMQASQPTTPYKVLAQLKTGMNSFANSQTSGIYFYDGTKLMGIEELSQTGGSSLRVERITNVTTDSATVASFPQTTGNPQSSATTPMWLQLRNNGSTLFFDYGFDGQNFTNMYSESVGTFITPTAMGFGGLSAVSTGSPFLLVNLLNWIVVANANLDG